MRILAPLTLLALAACAGNNHDALSTTGADASVRTAVNPAATFDRYRTFSFGPSEGAAVGYQSTPRSLEVQRRLQPLIAAALMKKGYLAVPAGGDLLISVGSGQRDVAVREQSSIGAEWLPSDENADFVEGSLVIDVSDATKGLKVWHGASHANINNPERINDEKLHRSVEQLLSAFPAATITSTAEGSF